MNCPSRTDEPPEDYGWNQSPPGCPADLTTRQDLNGMVNLRAERDSDSSDGFHRDEAEDEVNEGHAKGRPPCSPRPVPRVGEEPSTCKGACIKDRGVAQSSFLTDAPRTKRSRGVYNLQSAWRVLVKFGTFIGPGFMISVAYIDPGNYSTDVAAGAATGFRLLFIVLMSNIFAILLQSLAVRLGSVTGLNLAEHCRAHLPRWLNFFLYLLGEAAIIATDIAEVKFSFVQQVAGLMLVVSTGYWLSYSP